MKRQNVGVVALSAAVMLAGTGCATLLSGTTQKLTIKSNPAGAQVRFADRMGTTPVTFMAKKGYETPLTITQGSDQRLVRIERKIDPATWLNLIPPLWPGFIVDAVTGAMMKYDAEVINMDFDSNEFSLTRFNE